MDNPDIKIIHLTHEEANQHTVETLNAAYAPSWAVEGNYTLLTSTAPRIIFDENNKIIDMWNKDKVSYMWQRNLTPEEQAIKNTEMQSVFANLNQD